MSKPATSAEYGTVVPHLCPQTARANHARFSDVKNFTARTMPVVKIGQIYEDLDPRCKGRQIQVLRVGGDGKIMVRTVAERECAPRTPSASRKDTLGDISFISQRRFRENSRGFRLVRSTPSRATHAYLLGSRLAALCNIALTEAEVRTADALIGLLGKHDAHEYLDLLDAQPGLVVECYLGGGIGGLLLDAALYADEREDVDEWRKTVLASPATARRTASGA